MSTNGDPPKAGVGLGTHSARGLVILFASSTVAKAITFVTQIILLYLLGQADFGVVSLAGTITVFIQVIEQSGVGDVLVRRRLFHRWAISGFWFSNALGLLSGLLIALGAPIAAAIYGHTPEEKTQLFWVLMILAPSSLSNALAVVPRAKLSRELRFRELAFINLANFSLQKALTVLFAAVGFGPYSFVLPTPIVGAIFVAFLWWWVRPPWRMKPQVKRWRYLVGDSTRLLGADFGRALIDQSDYILLGIFRSVAEVGIYTVGFLFSIQMLQLLMVNMMNILFPAFVQLNDKPQKQFQGFMRAQRIFAMLGVSGCLLQAAVAEPISLLAMSLSPRFEKWEPSIIIMQILSLGMATRMIVGGSLALMKSQGRFTELFFNRWICVAIQVIVLTLILMHGGSVVAVAIAVSIIASLIGPLTFYQAVRRFDAGWMAVVDVLAWPVICGTLSIGVAWLVSRQMAAAGFGNFAQLVEIVGIAVPLNALLAWAWMRPVWDDFWMRVGRLLPQRAAG